MQRRVTRVKRLNPYRPATDLGLIKVFLLLFAIVAVIITGSLDCRYEFIQVGFC